VDSATPDWLEVPETGRRLMVDKLYPQLGIAVWFKGYRHGRQQDQLTYEQTLSRLCHRAGFALIVLNAKDEISVQKLAEINTALSTSARHIAQGKAAPETKADLLPRIAAAKATCRRIQEKLSSRPQARQTSIRWQQRRQRTQASWRQLRSSWKVFAENRLAVFGVVLLLVFALLAVAHPILMATLWEARIYSPDTGFDTAMTHPSPPSSKHLLGTDTVGRDVLSVLLASTAPTFVVGLTAAITAALLGTISGALAAYFRGGVDTVSMQIADAFLLVPAPLLMIIIGSRFQDMSPAMFGLLYGVVAGLSAAAIVIRSHALTIMSKPFIEAARAAGGEGWYIIRKHLIPHLLPLAAIFMMTTATGAVIADGFVSFLGITRTHHNWGGMIFWSFAYQAVLNPTVTWNVLIPPAIAFSLFAASFYFISRGLQQVADPKLRQESRGGS
jgi:peptide/nickel transport system permease protein